MKTTDIKLYENNKEMCLMIGKNCLTKKKPKTQSLHCVMYDPCKAGLTLYSIDTHFDTSTSDSF